MKDIIRKLKMREKAENDALNIIESDDVCPISFFTWSDPIKARKAVTGCKTYGLKCHEPCLRKSGFVCLFERTKSCTNMIISHWRNFVSYFEILLWIL